MHLYISVILIIFVLNFLGFFLAYLFQTDKFTDITYTLSFICSVLFALKKNEFISILDWIIVGMVLLWAVRLGLFLLIRIYHKGSDLRFDGMRPSILKFGSFWFLQAVSVLLIIIPAITVLNSDEIGFSAFQIAGVFIFFAGFTIEVIADYQKARFKKEFPNKFISTGLYKWIRYPNYLGEILIWSGIWIFGISIYYGIYWLTIISPIWIVILLRYISGIPLVERSRKKKYMNDENYRKYVSNTNLLIP